MNSRTRLAFPVLVGISALGCVHAVELQPAPEATLVPGQRDVATAENAGVRVIVAGEWQGEPSDLWRTVIPVRTTVENHTGGPIGIHYKAFTITTSSGFQAHALSPFNVRRPGVIQPFYAAGGFYLAPPFGAWYPAYPLWDTPFDYDPDYFDTYYQWQEALPSPDMLARALPVGVLQNSGTVTGYLYFQKVAAGIRNVTFNADFRNAKTGADVAKISIPFVVTNNPS